MTSFKWLLVPCGLMFMGSCKRKEAHVLPDPTSRLQQPVTPLKEGQGEGEQPREKAGGADLNHGVRTRPEESPATREKVRIKALHDFKKSTNRLN